MCSEWGEMREGAHGGEGCGIWCGKVVSLRQCQTQIVDWVDGYSLLPNHCVLATCLQSNDQIPSSQFARAFFLSIGCEISQKIKMIIIILYHFKKCFKFELFLFLFVVREQKLMKENKQYFNFQHEMLEN